MPRPGSSAGSCAAASCSTAGTSPPGSSSSHGSGGWPTTSRCGRHRWTGTSSAPSPTVGADVVDELRVRGLLDRMGAEIDGLRRLAGRGDAELRRDEDLLAAVKYRFIVALEVCIDLGRHLVASKGLRARWTTQTCSLYCTRRVCSTPRPPRS